MKTETTQVRQTVPNSQFTLSILFLHLVHMNNKKKKKTDDHSVSCEAWMYQTNFF